MAHKILVVTGSPRAGGNTSKLADAFVEGAEQAGNEVFRFDAGKADISGCTDCKHCFTHDGECRIKDDMLVAYELLRKCDILVLATPIYFFSMTAQIKAFIDRMFCMVGKPFTITSSILLTVQEDKDLIAAQAAVDAYKRSVAYIRWEDRGVISVPSVNELGAIDGNPKLDEARALGASLTEEACP